MFHLIGFSPDIRSLLFIFKKENLNQEEGQLFDYSVLSYPEVNRREEDLTWDDQVNEDSLFLKGGFFRFEKPLTVKREGALLEISRAIWSKFDSDRAVNEARRKILGDGAFTEKDYAATVNLFIETVRKIASRILKEGLLDKEKEK